MFEILRFGFQEVCSAFSRAQEFERQLETRRLEEERSMAAMLILGGGLQ